MKKIALGLAPLSLVIGLNTWASLGNPSHDLNEQTPKGMSKYAPQFMVDGIYLINRDALVLPQVSIIGDEEYEGEEIRLFEDEKVAVEFLPDNKVAVKLALAPEEYGEVDEIEITYEQFLQLQTTFVMKGGALELAEVESGYENTTEARRGGGGAKARRHGFRRSGRMVRVVGGRVMARGCVAYVQAAIGWRGGPVGNGVGMVRTLLRSGWHPVSCSSPQHGDVASWSGGGHGKGHTAVWQGGWCYDKGCNPPGGKFRMQSTCARRGGGGWG